VEALGVQLRETLWMTARAPVPERLNTSGEFGALLISVMVPEKVPAEAGAKAAEKEAEAPGARESGTGSPEREKPMPEAEACEMVRLAVPGF